MPIYCLVLSQILATALIPKDAFRHLGKQLTLPIPKKKPPKDINKDLRSISLTSLLSKVAEEFVVEKHVIEAS